MIDTGVCSFKKNSVFMLKKATFSTKPCEVHPVLTKRVRTEIARDSHHHYCHRRRIGIYVSTHS